LKHSNACHGFVLQLTVLRIPTFQQPSQPCSFCT
jgi:hypothetical protein